MRREQWFVCKIFILIVFGSFAESSQGIFHKNSFQKTLKISMMNKHFLENIIAFQQNFLTSQQKCRQATSACSDMIQTMMQMNQSILQTQEISQSQEQSIFALIAKYKKYLYEQQESLFCAEKNQALQAWWHFLDHACNQVQVQGYQQDFVWLRGQMRDIVVNQFDAQKATIIRLISMSQELMQKFNGLLVNDYDFLVLANITVALVAVRC